MKIRRYESTMHHLSGTQARLVTVSIPMTCGHSSLWWEKGLQYLIFSDRRRTDCYFGEDVDCVYTTRSYG